MLSSGLLSCVRLRRSSRGGVMYGTACYVKSGSGGHGEERFVIAWRFMVKAVKSGCR